MHGWVGRLTDQCGQYLLNVPGEPASLHGPVHHHVPAADKDGAADDHRQEAGQDH